MSDELKAKLRDALVSDVVSSTMDMVKSCYLNMEASEFCDFLNQYDKRRHVFEPDADRCDACNGVETVIPEIDQAYRGAGWLEPHTADHTAESLRAVITYSMTPVQWLSRFKSELEAERPYHDPQRYEYLHKYAMAIAERATK